jgi:hypothetical protein
MHVQRLATDNQAFQRVCVVLYILKQVAGIHHAHLVEHDHIKLE